MTPDSIPLHIVQTAIRLNLPFFGIASVVFIAGIASLALAGLRSRDRLLLWLGILSILYASRLFLKNGLVHVAIGGPHRDVLLCSLCLTYVISIPFGLFARELLGSGWKKSISAWVWIAVLFALVAIPATLFGPRSHWIDPANGILVMAGTLLILLHIVFRRERPDSFSKGLKWPLIVFGLLVLLRNQGIQPGGIDIEPIGFLVLLGGLGFTASRHAVARERKLTEVEQELTTARRIQSSILPDSSPDFPGLRLATRYQPMTSVAGDFFGFLKTGEKSLTILVADVSGHGIPAALVASMLKVCFEAQREQAHDPAKILAGLNAMLRGSLGGQYVTAACAALDTEAQTVTYAAAGHPPALLLRRQTGEVMPLAENGLFLGPFPQATYANLSVPFEPGDKLLLYTDGILEAARPDGQEFGQKGLEHFLQNTKHLEPAEFIEQLFRKISTPPQQDDLTAVLAQFA